MGCALLFFRLSRLLNESRTRAHGSAVRQLEARTVRSRAQKIALDAQQTADGTRTAWEKQVRSLQADITTLTADASKAAAKLARAITERDEARDRLAQRETKLGIYETQAQHTQVEIFDMNRSLERERSKLEMRTRERDLLHEHLADLRAALSSRQSRETTNHQANEPALAVT